MGETESVENRTDADEVVAVREQLFGALNDKAGRYADWLTGPGVERGLIGPRETPRIWTRHILNCAVIGEVIPENVGVLDVGSGAGLPGIVLALHRPDLRVTLVEPLARRMSFLTEVVEDLALPNVELKRSRAEELIGKLTSEVVTARAVAPLDKLGRWTLPLLRLNGSLVAIKGSSAKEEVTNHWKALKKCGAEEATVTECGVGVLEQPTTVVVVRKDVVRKRPSAHQGVQKASR